MHNILVSCELSGNTRGFDFNLSVSGDIEYLVVAYGYLLYFTFRLPFTSSNAH